MQQYFSIFHKSRKTEALDLLRRQRCDVIVTTFETCRDHVDELNKFRWSAVVADEAHKIKVSRSTVRTLASLPPFCRRLSDLLLLQASKAEVTRALKRLRCECRFALTGTPLQNNLNELWCIADW